MMNMKNNAPQEKETPDLSRVFVTSPQQQAEVDRNAEAFLQQLPSLIDKGLSNKFVIMRNCKVVKALDSFEDAVLMGKTLFPDDPFSVQEVSTQMVELGSYSY